MFQEVEVCHGSLMRIYAEGYDRIWRYGDRGTESKGREVQGTAPSLPGWLPEADDESVIIFGFFQGCEHHAGIVLQDKERGGGCPRAGRVEEMGNGRVEVNLDFPLKCTETMGAFSGIEPKPESVLSLVSPNSKSVSWYNFRFSGDGMPRVSRRTH